MVPLAIVVLRPSLLRAATPMSIILFTTRLHHLNRSSRTSRYNRNFESLAQLYVERQQVAP